ncbi:MAG: hypothetical protein U9N78_05475 [Actinomycetota bacterium]|nr:hypothetical protein [Actinomycetota bacterium]
MATTERKRLEVDTAGDAGAGPAASRQIGRARPTATHLQEEGAE